MGSGGEARPAFTNCTFTGNSAAHGDAFYLTSREGVFPSHVSIVNSILWNGEDEIFVADRSTVTVAYSDIKGGLSSTSAPVGRIVWGMGNIDADPCFVDAPAGDFHLRSQAGRWDAANQSWVRDEVTSPCIDAGDPLSPIGLEPFPNGGRANMGAYGRTGEASRSWFGGPVCDVIVAGDLNGDCKVDFADITILAGQWMWHSPQRGIGQ